jgi:hypothetical protein
VVLELIKGANPALRFLLELCALVALAYWGFETGGGAIAKVALGIGAPLVAAVVWGAFVAPRAPVKPPGVVVLLLEVLVFGSAAAALAATGHRTLDARVRSSRRDQRHPDACVGAMIYRLFTLVSRR